MVKEYHELKLLQYQLVWKICRALLRNETKIYHYYFSNLGELIISYQTCKAYNSRSFFFVFFRTRFSKKTSTFWCFFTIGNSETARERKRKAKILKKKYYSSSYSFAVFPFWFISSTGTSNRLDFSKSWSSVILKWALS